MPTLEQASILIVDDERSNINILLELLSDSHQLFIAKSGQQALRRVSDASIDLILLDIVMPEMDGYEVCRRLKSDPQTAGIPVIFLTAMTDQESETLAFDTGAVDFITKPITRATLLSRVNTHLRLSQASRKLENYNHSLQQQVEERTREIAQTQDATIYALASLAEAKDTDTGRHLQRTQEYVRLLATELARLADYSEVLDARTIDLLFKSAPLHDIGKVGIPDHILNKPGRLTREEFEVMKEHPGIGRDAIARAEKILGSNSFLKHARELTYSHHEWWDGSGYPEGLAGRKIPLSGRLMAISDVYDALISQRVYKPAMSHKEAVAYIINGSGKQFDPDVVDAFRICAPQFDDIAQRLKDATDT